MRSAFQFLLRDIFPSFYFYSDSSFDRQDFVVSVCVCVCEAHFSIHLLTISIGQTDVYDEGPRQKNSIYICGQTQHNGNGNKQKNGPPPNKRGQLCRFPTLVETLYGCCCSVWLSIDLDQHHSINKRIVASSLSPFWSYTQLCDDVQEIPLKHSKTKTNKEEPPKQIRQIKIERRNIYLGLWLKNVILIVYVLVTRKNREKTSFFLSFFLLRRRRRRRRRWAVKEEKRWAGASSVIIRGQKRDFRHKRAVKRKKPDIFIPYQLTPPLLSLFSPFFCFLLSQRKFSDSRTAAFCHLCYEILL